MPFILTPILGADLDGEIWVGIGAIVPIDLGRDPHAVTARARIDYVIIPTGWAHIPARGRAIGVEMDFCTDRVKIKRITETDPVTVE